MAERPSITTERLVLRPFTLADAPTVARLAGDRQIAATTIRIPHPYTLADAESWIGSHQELFEEGRSLPLAVTGRDGGELVGAVGLETVHEHRRAELGYWIGKEYWNRGYASEAAAAMVRFGFESLGLNRIFAHYFRGNDASGRVLAKAGLRPEGRARAFVRKWVRFVDGELVGVVREDLYGSQAEPVPGPPHPRKAPASPPQAGSDPLPPALETPRLILRAAVPADAPALQRVNSHPEVAAGSLTMPHPYHLSDAEEAIRRFLRRRAEGVAACYVITLRQSGELIGDIHMRFDDANSRAGMGYSISPPHWNRGYATEAVHRLIRDAVLERPSPVNRVFAEFYADNPASGRVLEKCGLQREGVLRQHILKDGQYKDLVLMGLLRQEFDVSAAIDPPRSP
jgi:RimJ/RimL family protein N-acetyltransferase